MHSRSGHIRGRHRRKWKTRRVAVCRTVRDYARVNAQRRQLSTLNYSQDDRDRLADAVTKARLADGYRSRSALARAAEISVRSLAAVERAEPGVGQGTLFAIGRKLSRWTVDTPRVILEGGPVPPLDVEDDEPEDEPLTDEQQRLLDIWEHVYLEKYDPDEAQRRLEADVAAAIERRRRRAG
jgi:hypothetical protein